METQWRVKTDAPVYLDYHSTTPVDSRVAEKVMYYMTTAFGNPSSVTHTYSDEAQDAIEKAKVQIASLVGADPDEIIFTSGATESICLAFSGYVTKNSDKKHKIAVLPVEHKAVLSTCKRLEKKGLAEINYLKLNSLGQLDLDDLEQKCREGVTIISVMAANNEIGNIYPLKEIGMLAREYNIPFLSDATQAVGKIPLSFQDSNMTFMAMSAHKMYGPKGIGALVIKKKTKIDPLLFGGGQQRMIRPGTLNVPGIVGLGEACYLRQIEMEDDEREIRRRRDLLQKNLQTEFPELQINGDPDNKLAGNLSFSVPGIINQDVISIIRPLLAVSTGSACNSGFENVSHVLSALGLSNERMQGTLRVGIGKFTSDQDINRAADILISAIKKVKSGIKN